MENGGRFVRSILEGDRQAVIHASHIGDIAITVVTVVRLCEAGTDGKDGRRSLRRTFFWDYGR